MREKRKKHTRIIHGANAEHFETALNEVFEQVSDPEVIFHQAVPFLAYITYTEIIEEPENVQEAYEMRGEYHHCGECPYYHEPTDGRVKYTDCDLGHRVSEKSSACRLFYKMLNEGTLDKPKKIIRR